VALRHRCSFVVIPMLNPDGSFLGNYRTCSLGTDLNRMWANPTEATEPTLFHTKELIRRLSEDDTVQLGKRERERERERTWWAHVWVERSLPSNHTPYRAVLDSAMESGRVFAPQSQRDGRGGSIG
jgi:hypothetical protein